MKIKPGAWWQWWVKKGDSTDPYRFFVEKFGYQPAMAKIGSEVSVNIPETTKIATPEGFPKDQVHFSVWPVGYDNN